MDDLGYFGPQSVTWRLHADPMQWVGGVRALFLMALHPLAMAGVAEHSTFREDPFGRLQRTGDYLGAVTFGTRAEADRAAARVRGVHRRVRGVEPESGTPYWAPDPELLLWVHCGEIDSFLTIGRRAGVRVSAADADRYVAEQVTAAELAGIPRELAPASVAELADYFERTRPALRMTAAARDTARFLFVPPMPALVQLATPARLVVGVGGRAGVRVAAALGPPALRPARAADHRPRRRRSRCAGCGRRRRCCRRRSASHRRTGRRRSGWPGRRCAG